MYHRLLHIRRFSSSPTKIEKIIRDSIRGTGPLSVARYMQLCLSHPTEGYYTRARTVIGRRGDFTTSPEISQVFGELVALWLLSQWKKRRREGEEEGGIRLVELGPGRGTLMSDVLRVISQFPQAKSALKSVHLVETSAPMRALQREALDRREGAAVRAEWHDSVEDVPVQEGGGGGGAFTMVLAHEFFDALPVHVLEKTRKGWQEVLVTTTAANANGLGFVLAPTPTPASTVLGHSSPRFAKLGIGARIEVCPSAFKMARRVGELVGGGGGGCGLIVDYGGEKAFGNSFRAFKEHKAVDVFYRPGECDLTANVDFAYLKEAMGDLGVRTHGPLEQGEFLRRMGIDVRVEMLQRGAERERWASIESGAKRLVDRSGMGREYVVLGIGGGEEEWPFV